jgi:hypothetical protein
MPFCGFVLVLVLLRMDVVFPARVLLVVVVVLEIGSRIEGDVDRRCRCRCRSSGMSVELVRTTIMTGTGTRTWSHQPSSFLLFALRCPSFRSPSPSPPPLRLPSLHPDLFPFFLLYLPRRRPRPVPIQQPPSIEEELDELVPERQPCGYDGHYRREKGRERVVVDRKRGGHGDHGYKVETPYRAASNRT